MKRKRDILNENLYGYRFIDPYYLYDEYMCYNELDHLVKVHCIRCYTDKNPEEIIATTDNRNLYLICAIKSFM